MLSLLVFETKLFTSLNKNNWWSRDFSTLFIWILLHECKYIVILKHLIDSPSGTGKLRNEKKRNETKTKSNEICKVRKRKTKSNEKKRNL